MERDEPHPPPMSPREAPHRPPMAVPDPEAGPSSGWPFWLPAATLLVGLLLTAALALGAAAQYRHNERRLLTLRVRDAGTVFTTALPQIQTSLASAAELAAATNGDLRKFRRYVMPLVGSGRQFILVSLWRRDRVAAGPLVTVGVPPIIGRPAASALFAAAARSRRLAVAGLLDGPSPRIGYAYVAPAPAGGFVVYAASALPPNRRSPVQRTSAFAGLDYALYLGRSERTSDLLLTSVPRLPLTGRKAAETIPFGDSSLRLVMTARHPLAGTLPQRLPWIIAIGGVLLTGAFSAAAAGLARRRRDAERLAAENRRLYAEQRGIAQTLQHSLLPDELPTVAGVQASARYEPGVRGVDVGGDWYDTIPRGEDRLLLVVGDVSGRGLAAATTMAALRYAVRGYAAQGDTPAEILSKLSDLLSVDRDGQLATVLCAELDIPRRELVLASAGHLPPLLLAGDRGEYLRCHVGLPVGVQHDAAYNSATIGVPAAATLLAFTDGLVERRRDPSIDGGLARLSAAATAREAPLDALLDAIVDALREDDAPDDIALLGIRWLS